MSGPGQHEIMIATERNERNGTERVEQIQTDPALFRHKQDTAG